MWKRAGEEKIDLLAVLAMAAAEPDLNSSDYLACVQEAFSCGTRAARDAISVLKQAGWLNACPDTRDRRTRRYRLSRSGRQVLESVKGRLLVRFARKLYTTCPSPGQAARQRRDPNGAQRKRQLKRAMHTLLNPDPSGRIRLVDAIPPPAPSSGPEQPRDQAPQLIVEPRCKVCRSPHRSEIDALLAAGHSQVDVRRRANTLAGRDHFTANNISTHLRRHLNEADPLVRRLLETRLERQQADKRRRHEQAVAVVEAGLEAIEAEVTDVTPRDLLRTIQLLEDIEANRSGSDDDLAEMRMEFDAFMEAVQAVIPDEDWQRLLEVFERRLARNADLDDWVRRQRLLDPSFGT
jgi:hypothetical protein